MSATQPHDGPVISLMIAVPDAAAAADWYRRGLGATELWNLGSVVGLEVAGAPFFLAEPANNGWDSPARIGTTTVRSRCSSTIPIHSSRAPSRPGRTGAPTGSSTTKRRGERTVRAGSSILSGTSGSSATSRR